MVRSRCLLLCACIMALAVPAAANVIYVEQGGRVVGEGELYSYRTTFGGIDWQIVPLEAPNASGGPAFSVNPPNYFNARGGMFVQSLPDNNAGTGAPVGATSVSVYYQMLINTTGQYRLYTRWQGHGGNSDSIYFSIVELADGVGGSIADWYLDGSGHSTANFNNDNWDGGGGFEQTGATPSPSTNMVWNITTPGIYTLRVEPREDGVSVDAFVFQLAALSAPTGYGPKRSPLLAVPSEDFAFAYTATADAYVQSGASANANFGTAATLAIKRDTSGTPGDYQRKGYVRFDIPALSPSMLFDAKLEFTAASAGGNWRLNILGLPDGHAGEGWGESTITWNNAPANLLTSGGGDPLLSGAGGTTGAIFLGQLDMTGIAAGDKLTLWDADTAGALLDFLLADTDGRVTFILTRMEMDTSVMSLASRESTAYDAPILTLYLLPEPGSLLLLGGGLAAAALRRRRRGR